MKQLWKTHPPLTAASLLMFAVLAASAVGLIVDPRTIAGAPAWLKPAKFGASIGIYGFTLVWIFRYLPDWPRTRHLAGWTTAVVGVIEAGLIALQAWRGTTSHFNVATPFDGAVFVVMGIAILAQWIASMAVAVALWRQRFEDAAFGWALRLGMIISVAGAGMGGLMTQPTSAQLAAARATHRLEVAGAHTVGGPDGGPGLPGTKWSTEHGDLRVPHFLGLHAMQLLPAFSLLLAWTRRRMSSGDRARLVAIAGASYAALTALLLWQALRGQSVVAPDGIMLTALAVWAVATPAAGVAVRFADRGFARLMPSRYLLVKKPLVME
jgi:hypothetical protein